MITDAHLLELNRLGLIPGPDEAEDAFLNRAEECLHLSRTQLIEFLQVKDDYASGPFLEQPLRNSQELYGISPDWIPLLFSNQGLAPWHGGCAWICQLRDNSPTIAFLQLRQPFATKTHYLGFYQRDELITHELSHIGRMAFEEPQFEEILAFRSSSSSFRRWLGPILQSAWEAWLFFAILLLLLLFDFAILFHPNLLGLEWALGLKIIPLALLGLGLGRLALSQRCITTCQRKLEQIFMNPQNAAAVLYRLQDSEIRQFSKLEPNDILHYAYEQGKKSLRWRLLLLAYFS